LHLGNGRQSRIYYSSTSSELIRGLGSLLLRFGIVGRLKESEKAGYRPSHQLHIYGSENQLRFLQQIGAHGSKAEEATDIAGFLTSLVPNPNVDTVPVEVWGQVKASMSGRGITARGLAAGMGTAYCGSTFYKHAPSRDRLGAVAELLEDGVLHQLAGSDLFWDTIVAVEPLGEQPVFDATVPGAHNFIANGIAAHNSIEQDSDVVLFVYREEMYKRDDPALRGRADILIAKQRNGPVGDVKLTFLHEFTKFVPFSPIAPGETEPGF